MSEPQVIHHHDAVVDAVPAPRRGPSPQKGIIIPAIVALIVGTIFVTVFLAAFHAPEPHGLAVGIVGSDQQVSAIESQLDEHAQGALAFARYADADAARAAIENREVLGAYEAGDATLLYAGANGPATTATLQGIFGTVAQFTGGSLTSTDVVPTSPGDTRSLSIFYAGFGIVLAGYLFGIISYQMARRLLFRFRVLSLTAFSLVSGLVTALIAGSIGFNALPGNLAAIAAVTVLLAAAVSGGTLLLMRIGGSAGTLLASVILLILGNATGGGTLPIAYLPVWLQPLSHILPVGIGIRALQGVSYFNDDGFVLGLVLLAVWAVGSLAVMYLVDWLKARRLERTGQAAVRG